MDGNYNIILTIVTVIAFIATGGIAWGSLRSRVAATEKDGTEMKNDLREMRTDIKEILKRLPKKQ